MLNQIVVANTICFDIADQLANNVHLVVSGENQSVALQADELLDNVHHAVCLENLLPQIVGGISIGISWVALATIVTGSVAALVERQEICMFASQFGGHPCLIQINAEVCKNALVELKAYLAGIAIRLPLVFRVLNALTGELVLQLKCKHRDTIDRKNHIHGIFVCCAVMPLTDAVENILLIVFRVGLVQRGLRHEIAYLKGHAPVFEAMAQHIQDTIHVTCIVECCTEFAHGIHSIHVDKTLPCLRLRCLNKSNQCVGVQSHLGIVLIITFGIAACCG